MDTEAVGETLGYGFGLILSWDEDVALVPSPCKRPTSLLQP